MKHLTETDRETIADPESYRRVDSKNSKLLDVLIERCIERLQDKSYKPRVRDALKAIQLKQKVAKASEAEKIFWELIESIRRDELEKPYSQTLNLEAQILNIIISLKPQVKNGILPVKTITDTFNQGRSKESQLTYHRIGRLLSSMGFRKAKTRTGTYAILWDDNLLPQQKSSNDEKNEKQNPASPACPVSPAGRSGAPHIRHQNKSGDVFAVARGSTTNYRGTTSIPSLLNNAAVTPSPFTSFRFLFIHPHPQDGLFCFSHAFFILNFLAICREAKAPRRRKGDRSIPF